LPRRDQFGLHVGQLELQGLKIGQRPVELAPFFHIGMRGIERRLRRTDGTGGDIDTAAVESLHGKLEASPPCPTMIGRHAHVVETDGAGGLAVPAHFDFLLAIADAGSISRHHQCGNSLGTFAAGTRHQHQHVGGAAPEMNALEPLIT